MTIEKTATGHCITYNDDEWDFIEKLSSAERRNIMLGLCTPYDYGYRRTEPVQEVESC